MNEMATESPSTDGANPAELPRQPSVARDALKSSRTAEPQRVVRVPTRTALNYGVDVALTLSFLALAWLMVIPQFAFPSEQESYRFRLWGAGIDDWRRLQMIAFCVFAFLIVVHLTLHWNWICSVTNTLVRSRPAGSDNGSRTLIGVGVLIGILHLFAVTLLWAKFSLKPVELRSHSQPQVSEHRLANRAMARDRIVRNLPTSR
jgi:uncharacterized membrane protein